MGVAQLEERLFLFIRGINVGNTRRLPMNALKEIVRALGATDVVTHLNSGNLVVTPHRQGLEEALAEAIADQFGFTTEVFSRTSTEMAEILRANPFPEAAKVPQRLHVAFLQEPPDRGLFLSLGLVHGQDRIGFGSRELYLAYSLTSHDSALVQVLK